MTKQQLAELIIELTGMREAYDFYVRSIAERMTRNEAIGADPAGVAEDQFEFLYLEKIKPEVFQNIATSISIALRHAELRQAVTVLRSPALRQLRNAMPDIHDELIRILEDNEPQRALDRSAIRRELSDD